MSQPKRIFKLIPKIIELYTKDKLPYKQISKILNIDTGIIGRVLKENNIPIRYNKINISIKKKAVDLYLQGISIKNISYKLKINNKTVRNILRDNNITIRGARKCLIGKQFGKLLVLEFIEQVNNQNIYLCLCSCGTKKNICGHDISSNRTKSCGCLKGEKAKTRDTSNFQRGSKHSRWKGVGELSGSYVTRVLCRAIKKHHKCDLDTIFLWDLFLKQDKKCAISGVLLTFSKVDCSKNINKKQTASLDRIDSSKGYTKDNVQWVHNIVNKMKLNHPERDFLNWCSIIVNNQNRINNSK